MKVRIGLEVHCQITSLKTKLFCSCSADYRQSDANSHVCPVCMGLPGSLPVLNGRAVEEAVKVALALNSRIAVRMTFYRKNYYYPDMPKNFQISQYDRAGGVPLATGGNIILKNGARVRIRRIQLEEDPGKISYEGTITSSPCSFIDYNRAGVALLEIVTEPDIDSPRKAREFLQKLRSILEHLGVCDGSLEGSMRCDANISLEGGRRVEIKNISSFKEVERALTFETTRQRSLLSRGITVGTETRHWDDVRRITVSLRTKEEEQDYRYFPEPDLVPIALDRKSVGNLERSMPELPDVRMKRLAKDYRIPVQQAEILTSHKTLADLFEGVAKLGCDPRRVSSWMVGEIMAYVNRSGLDPNALSIRPEDLSILVRQVDEGKISEKVGKTLLLELLRTGRLPSTALKAEGFEKISSREEIQKFVEQVFNDHPEAVKDALVNEKTIHFIIGQLMRLTKGRADPALARHLIVERLDALKPKLGL